MLAGGGGAWLVLVAMVEGREAANCKEGNDGCSDVFVEREDPG